MFTSLFHQNKIIIIEEPCGQVGTIAVGCRPRPGWMWKDSRLAPERREMNDEDSGDFMSTHTHTHTLFLSLYLSTVMR